MKEIQDGETEKGFWRLFDFLVKDLIPMTGQDLSEEIEKTSELLESVDKQEKVVVAKEGLAIAKEKAKVISRASSFYH